MNKCSASIGLEIRDNWKLENLLIKTLSTRIITYCLLFALIFSAFDSAAQRQLVLLKKEKVLLRLNPGDEMIVSLRGEKRKLYSYVNNLYDTAVVLHKTVVPLHQIDRVYFSRTSFMNLIGKFLVVAGVGYFVIDQFNVIVVEGEDASLNDDVTKVSAALVGVGLPMALIKKKSQRIHGRYRLISVGKTHLFTLSL